MSDEKLTETLAALAAGKKPPCPFCGDTHCDPDADHRGACWGCRSELDVYGQDRSSKCYERELSALRAEVDDWKDRYSKLSNVTNYENMQTTERELRAEVARLREVLKHIAENEFSECPTDFICEIAKERAPLTLGQGDDEAKD